MECDIDTWSILALSFVIWAKKQVRRNRNEGPFMYVAKISSQNSFLENNFKTFFHKKPT